MNCKTSIFADDRIVYTQIQQPTISHTCIYRFLNEAVHLGIERRLNRYFFDIQGAKNIDENEANTLLDFKQIYNLGFYWKSRIVAVLDDPIDEWHRQIESHLQEAAFDFRLFTEKEPALEWLVSPINKR